VDAIITSHVNTTHGASDRVGCTSARTANIADAAPGLRVSRVSRPICTASDRLSRCSVCVHGIIPSGGLYMPSEFIFSAVGNAHDPLTDVARSHDVSISNVDSGWTRVRRRGSDLTECRHRHHRDRLRSSSSSSSSLVTVTDPHPHDRHVRRASPTDVFADTPPFVFAVELRYRGVTMAMYNDNRAHGTDYGYRVKCGAFTQSDSSSAPRDRARTKTIESATSKQCNKADVDGMSGRPRRQGDWWRHDLE